MFPVSLRALAHLALCLAQATLGFPTPVGLRYLFHRKHFPTSSRSSCIFWKHHLLSSTYWRCDYIYTLVLWLCSKKARLFRLLCWFLLTVVFLAHGTRHGWEHAMSKYLLNEWLTSIWHLVGTKEKEHIYFPGEVVRGQRRGSVWAETEALSWAQRQWMCVSGGRAAFHMPWALGACCM